MARYFSKEKYIEWMEKYGFEHCPLWVDDVNGKEVVDGWIGIFVSDEEWEIECN